MFQQIVALSDIHGDVQRMGELLREGGVLHENGTWKSEETLLVFIGDYFNRGPHGIAVVNEIRRLEKIAPEGSEVVALLGNHDAMILSAAIHFRDGKAALSWEHLYITERNRADMDEILAVSKDEDLITWLLSLKALHVEGDYLFQHIDGVLFYRTLGAERPGENVATINAELRSRLQTCLGAWTVFSHMTDDRRFWGTSVSELRAYLDFFGAKCVVHGHTPTRERQPEVYLDGLAINIDGKMSIGYGQKSGRGFLWSVELCAVHTTL